MSSGSDFLRNSSQNPQYGFEWATNQKSLYSNEKLAGSILQIITEMATFFDRRRQNLVCQQKPLLSQLISAIVQTDSTKNSDFLIL